METCPIPLWSIYIIRLVVLVYVMLSQSKITDLDSPANVAIHLGDFIGLITFIRTNNRARQSYRVNGPQGTRGDVSQGIAQIDWLVLINNPTKEGNESWYCWELNVTLQLVLPRNLLLNCDMSWEFKLVPMHTTSRMDRILSSGLAFCAVRTRKVVPRRVLATHHRDLASGMSPTFTV